MRSHRILVLLAAVLLVTSTVTAPRAKASTMGYTFTPDEEWGNFIADDWVLGFSFLVNETIFVNELGIYDYLGDGLVNDHVVALFSEDGTVLSQTIISAGTQATLAGNFRFQPVEGLFLDAGGTYYLGAHYLATGWNPDPAGSDTYAHAFDTFSTASQISFLDRRYEGINNDARDWGVEWDGTGDLPFPAHLGDEEMGEEYGFGYLGPNFRFAETPEPGTMALVGFGLLVFAYFTRKIRIQR